MRACRIDYVYTLSAVVVGGWLSREHLKPRVRNFSASQTTNPMRLDGCCCCWWSWLLLLLLLLACTALQELDRAGPPERTGCRTQKPTAQDLPHRTAPLSARIYINIFFELFMRRLNLITRDRNAPKTIVSVLERKHARTEIRD